MRVWGWRLHNQTLILRVQVNILSRLNLQLTSQAEIMPNWHPFGNSSSLLTLSICWKWSDINSWSKSNFVICVFFFFFYFFFFFKTLSFFALLFVYTLLSFIGISSLLACEAAIQDYDRTMNPWVLRQQCPILSVKYEQSISVYQHIWI